MIVVSKVVVVVVAVSKVVVVVVVVSKVVVVVVSKVVVVYKVVVVVVSKVVVVESALVPCLGITPSPLLHHWTINPQHTTQIFLSSSRYFRQYWNLAENWPRF